MRWMVVLALGLFSFGIASAETAEEFDIRVWDEHTAEGTEIGSLQEMDPSIEDLAIADLGMDAILQNVSLQCAKVKIVVERSSRPQTLSAYCDNNVILDSVLTSTGPGNATPLGTHTVYNKIFMAYSRAYNSAPMARMLVFASCGKNRPNCIGVHATVKSNYKHLGSPKSHGCVRLTMENAVKLWSYATAAGVVTVTVR